MSDWNHDLNPIPAEGKFYLKNFREHGSSAGNPVEDLTEIMIDCYELLATISKDYTPTGNASQDDSVKKLKTLFEHWPASVTDNLREGVALNRNKPTHTPPPPPNAAVFEAPPATIAGQNAKEVRPRADDSQKPMPKSVSTPSLSAIKDNSKNNDYFLKLKEDEAEAKRKQEEEEANMKPDALKKLQEERRLAEEHDNSKTAHLSKLGSKYMPAKKKNSTGEIVIERGGGGRGRGRGRGGH